MPRWSGEDANPNRIRDWPWRQNLFAVVVAALVIYWLYTHVVVVTL